MVLVPVQHIHCSCRFPLPSYELCPVLLTCLLRWLCPLCNCSTDTCGGCVQQMMRFYADKGDIQMCATVLLVLGPMGEQLFPSRIRKQWLMGYIGTCALNAPHTFS